MENQCHVPNHQPDWVYSKMVHESGIPFVFPFFHQSGPKNRGWLGGTSILTAWWFKSTCFILRWRKIHMLHLASAVERNRSTWGSGSISTSASMCSSPRWIDCAAEPAVLSSLSRTASALQKSVQYMRSHDTVDGGWKKSTSYPAW